MMRAGGAASDLVFRGVAIGDGEYADQLSIGWTLRVSEIYQGSATVTTEVARPDPPSADRSSIAPWQMLGMAALVLAAFAVIIRGQNRRVRRMMDQ